MGVECVWQSVTAQGLVDVSAVIHLVMIYHSHLLLNWLDYLLMLKIHLSFKETPKLNELKCGHSLSLPCLLNSPPAAGIMGWQVHGSEPATSLKFPERHFLGRLIKLCVLAYRSFPGFEEERERETKRKIQAVQPQQQDEQP